LRIASYFAALLREPLAEPDVAPGRVKVRFQGFDLRREVFHEFRTGLFESLHVLPGLLR
jgi:hypothetical protein